MIFTSNLKNEHFIMLTDSNVLEKVYRCENYQHVSRLHCNSASLHIRCSSHVQDGKQIVTVRAHQTKLDDETIVLPCEKQR